MKYKTTYTPKPNIVAIVQLNDATQWPALEEVLSRLHKCNAPINFRVSIKEDADTKNLQEHITRKFSPLVGMPAIGTKGPNDTSISINLNKMLPTLLTELHSVSGLAGTDLLLVIPRQATLTAVDELLRNPEACYMRLITGNVGLIAPQGELQERKGQKQIQEGLHLTEVLYGTTNYKYPIGAFMCTGQSLRIALATSAKSIANHLNDTDMLRLVGLSTTVSSHKLIEVNELTKTLREKKTKNIPHL